MSLRNSLVVSALALTIAVGATTAAQAAGDLVRIATVPAGAEVTGLSTNALGELFMNAQHPGKKNAYKEGGKPALIGYIAGFDSRTYKGNGMSIPAVSDQVHVADGNYEIFAKAGDKLGSGQLFGGVYNTKGELMYVSNAPDFNGFVPLGANKAYLYTAWEGAGRDGASGVSRLLLNRTNGVWKSDLTKSKMLDLSSIDGGFVMCSGLVTPWGTPLMAEEYFYYGTEVWNHPANHDDDRRPGYKGGNDVSYIKPVNMTEYLGKMTNPYRYGYMIEANNAAAASDPDLVKHYVTGRLSHETAAIMPDMKTVYMSDDDSGAYVGKKYNTASGGVLFKFVADVKGDLSAGTLYAAKLKQDAGTDPHKTGFDVTWVMLGHSNNATVAGWISDYDNVKVSDYVEGQSSYVSNTDVNNWAEGRTGKDLNGDGKTGSYKDDRVAFLESRKAAAALGATNEWDKLEGVTSVGNMVYLGISAISYPMDKTWGHLDWATGKKDAANVAAIGLDREDCGGTYVATTGDDFNITRLDPHVIGKTVEGKRCDPNLPANPDNILAMADGSLMIGEDAGAKKHALDMLWMKRP